MANIKIPKKELEKAGIKLTKDLEEQISLFGTPLESISEEEIEIEIFPDRPDLLSAQGFIRSFKAFLGKSPGLKKYNIKKSGYKLIVEKSLPREWPYAVACIVKGIKFDDGKIKEVIDIQEKLGATLMRNRKKGGIGLYPLENLKFPIKFKGLDPDKTKFRPLEFPQEISGRQILSKHPTGRTYSHLVESWTKFPFFVDNSGKIMSMPPIINSHDTGKMDETTENVFVECTGTDLEVIKAALTIIVTALADMGGTIYTIECTQQNNKKENIPDLTPQKTKLSLENTNNLLGLNLKYSDLSKLLPKMGHEYKKPFVFSPAWRTDILHEVDIAEDVAIAYGYNKLVPKIPSISTIGSESKESKINSKLSEILAGLGLLEISSYHLIKDSEAKLGKLTEEEKLHLEDSKTEYKLLRPNLTIPALRILSENKDNDYPQKVFEIGTVFSLPKSKEKPESGISEQENLLIATTPGNSTEIIQILDYLTRSLGIPYELEEFDNELCIPGRSARISINKRPLGFFGEVHPKNLRNWGIKMPLVLLEISLEEIYKSLEI